MPANNPSAQVLAVRILELLDLIKNRLHVHRDSADPALLALADRAEERYGEERAHGFEYAVRVANAEAISALLAAEAPDMTDDLPPPVPDVIRLDLTQRDGEWLVTSPDVPGLLAAEHERDAACSVASLTARRRLSLLTLRPAAALRTIPVLVDGAPWSAGGKPENRRNRTSGRSVK